MATNLLSVAGLVGSPITVGTRAGRIADLVVRHGSDDTYPEITGLVVRVGRRLLFAATSDVDRAWSAARRRSCVPLDLIFRRSTSGPATSGWRPTCSTARSSTSTACT